MFDAPMFKNESTKTKANRTEQRVAKSLGLKQQPNSGAGDWRKGDFIKSGPESVEHVKGRKFVGDAKSTEGNKHKSVRVTDEMIYKIIRDMHEERGDEWFIPLVIAGELMGVVISPELFTEITEK